MSSHPNPGPGKAGVIKAPDDGGTMDQLTHTVLDDLLYNIVHDLLIKVHRDEKIARANTAAIRVEKLASDTSDSSNPDVRPDVKVETDAALYDEGKVFLRGNPLVTTKDIVCPRCHLPRLLYPTDGKGARKPDPSIIYCKKHPYIDKPGYDIYGQTWVAQGPGRGKKKKDMEKKIETPQDSPTPNTEGAPATTGGGGAASRPPNMLSFPSATCSKCKRCILVTRLNNHMGSCIGNSGRNASRAAAQKISNGNGNGDGTPPSSQKGTPMPGSRANSPRKRDGDEMKSDDDESDNDAPKKKKLKPTLANNPPKKLIVKAKAAGAGAGPKKEKVKASSLLSVEHKVNDDDADGPTVEVAPKKKVSKGPSPAKKLKLGLSKPTIASAPKVTAKTSAGSNGGPGGGGGGAGGSGGGDDGESESSGTLSSPPVV